MDLYHLSLYVHIMALVAAAMASSLLHFAMYHAERAPTVSEAGRWLRIMPRVTKIFPAALLTFFITGGYMVSKTWSWQTGFVQVGATAALLLLVNGIVVGTRMRRMPMLLKDAAPNGPMPAQAAALLQDAVVSTLPWVNTAIALGTAFVMTTKPALAGSIVSLIVAIAAGLVLANRMSPRRVHATSPQAATERA